MKRLIAMLALIALGFLPGLGGCKTIEKADARNTGDLLTAAGFRQVPANTPERTNDLQTMKPRTIKMIQRGGESRYVYSDPSYCKCLYVGAEQNYKEYQQLALQKKIAEEKMEAAEAAQTQSLEQTYWGPWW